MSPKYADMLQIEPVRSHGISVSFVTPYVLIPLTFCQIMTANIDLRSMAVARTLIKTAAVNIWDAR